MSYSHKDTDWLDRLSTFLKPYTKQGRLNVWADPYIQVGNQWRRNISAAPGQAKRRAMLGAFTIRIGGNV